MNMHENKHVFAVYVPILSSLLKAAGGNILLSIDDVDLYHRVYTVLRLDREEVILFDESQHILFNLQESTRKKVVQGEIKEKAVNKILTPSITVLLPLLKREAFSDALYTCVELGATTIVPVITAKVKRGDYTYDAERAKKIMIAAAEQSKNFSFPLLKAPQLFAHAVEHEASQIKIYADPCGEPFASMVQSVAQQKKSCAIAVGPEGGLMADEVALLQTYGFKACALTPTILRAQQAIVLALGAVRAAMSA